MKERWKKKAHPFTLIELLTVLGTIAILTSVLAPALNKARLQSQVMSCQSNLRQLVQAKMLYADDHQHQLPYTEGDDTSANIVGLEGPSTKNWWNANAADYSTSWAGKIFEYLNDINVYACSSAEVNKTDSTDPMHLCSYTTVYETSRRRLTRVHVPSAALLVFDNNASSNTARTFYFSQGHQPSNHTRLQEHIGRDVDQNTHDMYLGTDSTDLFRICTLAHSDKLNACFADGHAANIGYAHLFGENVTVSYNGRKESRDLREDYHYIWFKTKDKPLNLSMRAVRK